MAEQRKGILAFAFFLIIMISVIVITVLYIDNSRLSSELGSKEKQLDVFRIDLINLRQDLADMESEFSAQAKQTDNFNELYIKAIENYHFGLQYGMIGKHNYNSCLYNMEHSLFNAVITTCTAAMENYAKSGDKYILAISDFNKSREYGDKEVISYYINASSLAVTIQELMSDAGSHLAASAQSSIKKDPAKAASEKAKAESSASKADSYLKEYDSYVSKIEQELG